MRAAVLILALLSVYLAPAVMAQSVDAELERLDAAFDSGDEEMARSLADSVASQLSGDDLETAARQVRVARVLAELGEPGEAAALYRKALAIHDANDHESAETGKILYELGMVESDIGGDTIQSFQRSVEIRRRELGVEHQDTLQSVLALAFELIWVDRLDEAQALLEESHRVAQEAYGPDGEPLIVLTEYLGRVADNRSDYVGARRLYERGLELCEINGEARSRRSAALYYRLARLDYIQGDNASADSRYILAEEIAAEALGPDHIYVGHFLMDHAAVLSDMGEFDRALKSLERASDIMESSLPSGHPSLGALYYRIGETEMRRDELDAAMVWMKKSLQVREEALGPDHSQVGATLKKMAQIHRQQGHPELAMPLLERIEAIRARAYGTDHPWYASVQYSMALNLTDLGEYDRALDKALLAEQIQRDQLRRATRDMAERTGLMYASDRSEGAGLKVALALATKDVSPEQLRRVWDAQVDARSFVLDELVYRRRALGEVDDDAVLAAWDELAAASSELARISTESPDPADEGLARARSRHERAQRRLAEIDDLYSHPPRADRLRLIDVESALPASTALVAFARYESYFTLSFQYLALVRAPLGDLHCLDLGDAGEIDDLVAQWRHEAGVGSLEASDPSRAESRYREVATRLRQRVWDPVQQQLGTADLALIVPDGQLSLVNLASLPTDDGRYLVESDLVLHVLDAERDAVAYRDPIGGEGSLLALGAPDFDAPVGSLDVVENSSAPPKLLLASAGEPAIFRGASSRCGSFLSIRFAPLPGSVSEVESIVASWPEPAGVVGLTGSDANEPSFKALAPHARVIHLATHGFFLNSDCTVEARDTPADSSSEGGSSGGDTRGVGGMGRTVDAPRTASPQENPLSLSGLALAGANTRDQATRGVDDGVLTAEEVAALNLSGLEWAVLSACESGVGGVQVGEGVLGLRRAFRAAGARTLIMSLWSVDDLATRDWMADLYAARFTQSMSSAEAARAASRARLDDRRDSGESTHPFYWAGFLATGDWH